MADLTDTRLSSVIGSAEERRRAIRKSLGRRQRTEKVFRGLGFLAALSAFSFVVILFGNIVLQGLPAFWQVNIETQVTFDPEVVNIEERPERQPGQSPAAFRQELLAWQRQVTMANWNNLIETAIRQHAPDTEIDTRAILSIVDQNARFVLRDMVIENPGIVGETVPIRLLGSANADNWIKGTIDRSLPDARQQLSPEARALADALHDEGVMTMRFAWHLFTNVDSRSAPASAGLAGAFMGSLYMMLVVIVLAVPIGVASAIYLEEFAPRNRFTDLIEVNINNLAAVPSIVFGLLGAAVFINYFRLPLSAPLVGGLVLTLMTLPTVIIATRSTLRAVPPSLRQAALGLGASRTQMVFHHVLPVTYPGILTASILGVAQALGETAPLLLIGMNAFVANIPATPLDQSAALPVQIYLWQGNENRNFFEPRTFAVIMVLLGLMLSLNALAIYLRSRLEKRK
jgi:phosphate transport system permease protein